jgi:hypothetical protein
VPKGGASICRHHLQGGETVEKSVAAGARTQLTAPYFAANARDDRPWGSTDPPIVAYVYAPDRKAARPIAHLAGFRGILQVDGYAGYKALAEKGEVRLAFCWAHVRRHFYELTQGGMAPIASEALTRIAALYRIEDEIRGRSAEERRAARQDRTRPLVEALQPWLREKLSLISQKTKLAEAIRYALSRWAGLSLFLDDGRIEIDNNIVERAIRPLALNRKNALFAGSDEGASCCSPHHAIDKLGIICWRSSGGGRRDRRISAWRRTSPRARSVWRIIQGAPLQRCVAGRAPSAMRRRIVVWLRARTAAASSIVASPRSACSPSR